MSLTNTFKPPKPIKPEWGSFIEGRNPKFKIHQHLGQAKQAIAYVLHEGPRGGTIYRWDTWVNDWCVWYESPRQTQCDWCGGELGRGGGRDHYPERRGHSKLNAFQVPRVCKSCYRNHFAYRATDEMDWAVVYETELWKTRSARAAYPS